MKKVLAVVLAVLTMVMIMPFSAFATNSEEAFCKIKKINEAPVYYERYEKIGLRAEYEVDSDEDVQLVWTIEGKSKFVDGDSKQMTTGESVTVKFLGNSIIKLQVVTTDGEVLAEDELEVKDGNIGGIKGFLANAFLSVYLVFFVLFGFIVQFFQIFS